MNDNIERRSVSVSVLDERTLSIERKIDRIDQRLWTFTMGMVGALIACAFTLAAEVIYVSARVIGGGKL